MSFWQNRRYQEIEKVSTGDPIRGLANKNFPWHLLYATFADNINDTWHYEISCLSIFPDKKIKQVRAQIFMIAESEVTKINLKQIGISNDRLDLINIPRWNYLEEKFSSEIICELEKVEENAKQLAEKWILQILNKSSLEYKFKRIMNNIKSSKISGFSE
ncbi:hypothetical protein QEJ31_13190 [Pigmentibacter sp. JX0631]|uniref:hypothetical protein n=1 Tax=Pigmentibacter sp. JX0631 TaxID=2976982 RepID=UPI002468301C|nr:hypothetical protein [Pigmentibacter sp. JX0631]WGL59479.1 hypothetical protein QEJ31_13190 [Pigmentibacter sp. JX0631]